jgi:cytochrome P450
MVGRMVATLDAVDLADVRLFADGPPLELFARLREEAPVHWTKPGRHATGFWSLTRHEDILAVDKDWATFSSALRGSTMNEGSVLPQEFARQMFTQMDPPEHGRHRAILQTVFTHHAVTARAPSMQATADRLIDGFAHQGRCDLVRDLAALFPLTVTAEMLGVPEAEQGKLFHWTNQMADTEVPRDQMLETVGEMAEYVLALVTRRRADPGDDLLSRLVVAELDGERLSDIELIVNFALLMVGGNETTRNAFAGGVLALLQHPEQHRALSGDPSLTPHAIEEIVRYHTPILHMARTATRDTEIDGTPIKENDRVVLWHCAGNRDPRANPDPDRFDIRRPRIRHSSFGGGIHFCLGNQIARLELSILLPTALRRLPDLTLAGPIERKPSNFLNWLTSLPLTFEPSRTGAEPSGH